MPDPSPRVARPSWRAPGGDISTRRGPGGGTLRRAEAGAWGFLGARGHLAIPPHFADVPSGFSGGLRSRYLRARGRAPHGFFLIDRAGSAVVRLPDSVRPAESRRGDLVTYTLPTAAARGGWAGRIPPAEPHG